MFNFIKKLFGLRKQEEVKPTVPYKIEAPAVENSTADTGEAAKVKPVRTRTKQGKFIADNPATPKNEAWSDGKSQAKPKPPRKPRKPRNNSNRKPAAK